MEKKPYHRKNLKLDLIEKGIELVNRDGVEKFSLRKLDAACGVSHAAHYTYFKKKEDLLDAMKKHITDRFSSALEETIDKNKNDPKLLKYMGISYVDFFINNPQYYSFLYIKSNMKIDLSMEKDLKQNYRPFEIFKDIILKLMDTDEYTEQEKEDVIVATWTFVHGIASVATMTNVHYDADWVKKTGTFLEMLDWENVKKG